MTLEEALEEIERLKAKVLDLEDEIDEVRADSYQNGYSNGNDAGWSEGYSAGLSVEDY